MEIYNFLLLAAHMDTNLHTSEWIFHRHGVVYWRGFPLLSFDSENNVQIYTLLYHTRKSCVLLSLISIKTQSSSEWIYADDSSALDFHSHTYTQFSLATMRKMNEFLIFNCSNQIWAERWSDGISELECVCSGGKRKSENSLIGKWVEIDFSLRFRSAWLLQFNACNSIQIAIENQ